MAKFNIEVELDWIEQSDEGYVNIDEALKNSILEKITKNMSEQVSIKINEKVNVLFEKKTTEVEKLINEKLNSLLENFLNTKRDITDKWGEVKQSDVSVTELLKKACDDFIDCKVDENGNVVTNRYENGQSRINYLIGKNIDDKMEYSIKRAIREVNEKLKAYIEKQLKEEIGENIAKAIGLDKLLEKNCEIKN